MTVAFTSQAGNKYRPAIVISVDGYNQPTPDVVVIPLTGNLTALCHPGDHVLRDWQSAGLAIASLAQAKPAAIQATLIGRKIGELSAADLVAVEQGLRHAFDL